VLYLQEIKESLERKIKGFQKSLKETNIDSYSSYYEFFAKEVPKIKKEVIQKCKKALEKIENGTFGICENCGKKIPPDRLKAVPSFELCSPKCS